jgi:ABC-2 type transport system permease protein
MKSLFKLTWVDTKPYLRDLVGTVFALIFPLIYVFLFGAISGNEPSPQYGGQRTLDASIPGLVAVIICAAGLMSTTMTTYREKGVLRRLRTTPVHPLAVLASQVVVVFAMTYLGMLLLVTAGMLIYGVRFQGDVPSLLGGFVLSSLSFFSLGFILAGPMSKVRSAWVVAQALLYPMMLLSGAFFTVELMPSAIQKGLAVHPSHLCGQSAARIVAGRWLEPTHHRRDCPGGHACAGRVRVGQGLPLGVGEMECREANHLGALAPASLAP